MPKLLAQQHLPFTLILVHISSISLLLVLDFVSWPPLSPFSSFSAFYISEMSYPRILQWNKLMLLLFWVSTFLVPQQKVPKTWFMAVCLSTLSNAAISSRNTVSFCIHTLVQLSLKLMIDAGDNYSAQSFLQPERNGFKICTCWQFHFFFPRTHFRGVSSISER